MAYAFIHGEVKGSGASVEFKGNGLDLLDLTIQIVGSVVAEVHEPLRPYVIKKIQDKIPDAVQNDLEAQGKAAPAEKKEKPPVGETVGFRIFGDMLSDQVWDDLDNFLLRTWHKADGTAWRTF